MAIRTLGDTLASDASAPTPPDFVVEGETRDLHPIVRDEIDTIPAEALRNAFRHARAKRVEELRAIGHEVYAQPPEPVLVS